VKEYKKSNVILMSLAVVSYFPIEFFRIPISLIYMCFWITAIIYINSIVFKKYYNKVQKLKRENDWFINNKHIIKADAEVSRLKDKMPISKLWFMPALAINLISLVNAVFIGEEFVNLILVLSSLSSFILFFLIYNAYSKVATKVYSTDSGINMACNYVYRRIWSIIWVLAATFISVPSITSFFDISLSLPITIIAMIIIVLVIIMGDRKIKSTQNKLVEISERDIYYVDDDEYWGACFYSNPNDPSLFVEKRVGIGTTINMANPTAKKLSIGFIAFNLIILIGTIGVVTFVTSSSFTVDIDENKVTIDSPLYGAEFNIRDIEEVSEVDNLPKGMRTNGAETEDYALGHYKLDNYGKSRVYVFKDQPKIILIKLKDQTKEQYIFLTADTTEETDEYFNVLRSIK